MKKYISFFRLRFSMGLQYRTAAAAGIVTQFFWGAMEILVYRAFYEADAAAFPMSLRGGGDLYLAAAGVFGCVWGLDHGGGDL